MLYLTHAGTRGMSASKDSHAMLLLQEALPPAKSRLDHPFHSHSNSPSHMRSTVRAAQIPAEQGPAANGVMSFPEPDRRHVQQAQPEDLQQAQHASHDLDANAQWLEILAPPAALPTSQPAGTASDTNRSTAIPARHAASADRERGMNNIALPSAGDGKQCSVVHVTRCHERPAKSTATAHMVRRRELLRANLPLRSSIQKPDASTGHGSSSCESSRVKTFTRRSHSRACCAVEQHSDSECELGVKHQVNGHHHAASSEESDQMTFAEAAGIRRRPDDISWPAYGAIQEGRQVQLLDRHSPSPQRSKAKARQHRTSSCESRSARHAQRIDDDPSGGSDPADAAKNVSHRARMRKMHGLPGAASRGSRHRGLHRVRGASASDDDTSSSMLDRLLSAWQQGATNSYHQEPFMVQNVSSTLPNGLLVDPDQIGTSQGSPDAVSLANLHPDFAVSMQNGVCQKVDHPDDSLLNAESPDPAQHTGHLLTGDILQNTSEQGQHELFQANVQYCVRGHQLGKHQKKMQQPHADWAADEMDAGRLSVPAESADDLLAGFWDTWQEAAKESSSIGDSACVSAGTPFGNLQQPKQSLHEPFEHLKSSPVDVLANGDHKNMRYHQRKHADRRKEQRHGAASEQLHRHQREHARVSTRALKHPAAAAACSRLVETAAADSLEALLQMFPGLDPVVADLILQVRGLLCLRVWMESSGKMSTVWRVGAMLSFALDAEVI